MAKPMITPLHTTLTHPTRQWSMPPSPVHTLRLSSASMLDGVITLDGAPAYSVETADKLTSIARCTSAGLAQVAQVQWPQHATKSETYVQLGHCLHQPEHQFLRRSAFSTSRKFRLAGTSYKWRHVPSRATYECSTSAGAPVAVYEPAVLTSAARIRLYAPFANDQPLVDVLVLTVLLLTCPPDEWRSVSTPFCPTQLQRPGDLPRYSALADAYDLPSSSSAHRRSSKLERELHHQSVRRVRSFAPSSSASYSSGFSSAPSSPASLRPPLPSLDTSFLSTTSSSTASSSASPVSSVDEPAAWSSRFILDLDKGLIPLSTHDESPPPYEQHQWTVRVPARAYTAKH
ncbi:hypothetical protein EXIGLDRAFT_722259 [Exidia glandulosa HHB12029]|uniref:DUF6593 domain-containing protein n=1 Tax=Exidia glandulosa HHB12029 TaxID=1314781 RepID=A0A165N4G4_EXIGL|nr:hypothetical protein EXIGLDRAFT_722259 [Exidia glandulosa HHB12029]